MADRPRITLTRIRANQKTSPSRPNGNNRPSRRKPDLEAYCLIVEGHLKKRAYLTASRTDLGVRVLRNTGTPLELHLATGRAELVEYDVYLVEKYQALPGTTKCDSDPE